MHLYSENYQKFNEVYNLIYSLQKLFVKVLEHINITMATPIIGIFVSVLLFGLHILIYNKKKNTNK